MAGKVFILPEDPESRSSGGIILPDSMKDGAPAQKGHVVARADQGRLLDRLGMHGEEAHATMDVQLGDRVLFGPYTGSKAALDGVEYFVADAEALYAIIPEGVK